MRLIACLSFYDEPDEPLYDAVASLAGVGITHLVSLDGAYAAYPGATGSSPASNHQAIQQASADTGLTLALHVPSTPWAGGEVEKRSHLFSLAHRTAEPNIDWLVSTDGDDHWTRDLEHPTLHHALAALPEDVHAACVQYAEVNASGQDTWQAPHRRCYRAQATSITVVGHHARYIAGDRTLWDASRPSANCPAATITGIQLRHKPWLRSRQRRDHRDAYYRARSDLKLEA